MTMNISSNNIQQIGQQQGVTIGEGGKNPFGNMRPGQKVTVEVVQSEAGKMTLVKTSDGKMLQADFPGAPVLMAGDQLELTMTDRGGGRVQMQLTAVNGQPVHVGAGELETRLMDMGVQPSELNSKAAQFLMDRNIQPTPERIANMVRIATHFPEIPAAAALFMTANNIPVNKNNVNALMDWLQGGDLLGDKANQLAEAVTQMITEQQEGTQQTQQPAQTQQNANVGQGQPLTSQAAMTAQRAMISSILRDPNVKPDMFPLRELSAFAESIVKMTPQEAQSAINDFLGKFTVSNDQKAQFAELLMTAYQNGRSAGEAAQQAEGGQQPQTAQNQPQVGQQGQGVQPNAAGTQQGQQANAAAQQPQDAAGVQQQASPQGQAQDTQSPQQGTGPQAQGNTEAQQAAPQANAGQAANTAANTQPQGGAGANTVDNADVPQQATAQAPVADGQAAAAAQQENGQPVVGNQQQTAAQQGTAGTQAQQPETAQSTQQQQAVQQQGDTQQGQSQNTQASQQSPAVQELRQVIQSLEKFMVSMKRNPSADAENLQEAVKSQREVADGIKSSLSRVTGEASPATQRAADMSTRIQIGNNLENFYYCQIPFEINQQQSTAELYVFERKQGGGKGDQSNTTILIALETENMGRVETVMRAESENNSMTIEFRVRDAKVESYLKEATTELQRLLAASDFKLMEVKVVQYEVETTPLNVDQVLGEKIDFNMKAIDINV